MRQMVRMSQVLSKAPKRRTSQPERGLGGSRRYSAPAKDSSSLATSAVTRSLLPVAGSQTS